jgi:hypothetical protein
LFTLLHRHRIDVGLMASPSLPIAMIVGVATAPLRSMIGDERHRNASPIGAGGYVTRPYRRWDTIDFMDVIAGTITAPPDSMQTPTMALCESSPSSSARPRQQCRRWV